MVDLVNRLEAEARAGRQGRLADQLCRVDLVVLDELGYLPFAQSGGQLLFHLVSRLYEQTSFCGAHDRHEYELYLAVENIDHTRIRTRSPQTNGICERFHKTLLEAFYRIAFRRKLYTSIAELQTDLDAWIKTYNEHRTHQGRRCFGKTPMQTFPDARHIAWEKQHIGEAA